MRGREAPAGRGDVDAVPAGSFHGADSRLARVLLRGFRLELEADEPVIADDLGVVAGLDHVHVAGTDLELGAVVMDHPHPA